MTNGSSRKKLGYDKCTLYNVLLLKSKAKITQMGGREDKRREEKRGKEDFRSRKWIESKTPPSEKP